MKSEGESEREGGRKTYSSETGWVLYYTINVCTLNNTKQIASLIIIQGPIEKNSIMIYPRLFHRHIAITALYLLLTLGVLGLIIILCTFNDTEHTYLFKSGSSSSNEKQLPSSARLDYEKTTIVTTPRHSTKPQINLKQDSNDAGEQQHIYIDELYTETTKPKRVYDNYINYRKMKFPAGTKRTKNNSSSNSNSNYNGSKKFRKLHVDDDTDIDNDDENESKSFDQEINAIDNDNEIVASGSGDGSQLKDLFNVNTNENQNQIQNNNFDLETQKFIRRIGIRLSQLSKRNTSDHKIQIKSELKRNKKLFRPGHIESKINYYRALELTAPSPIPTLKLNNISNWSEKSAAFPFWTATQSKTRRIIGNERKSAERSRQLLLCEKGKSGGGGGGGGGELCRMLFKET